jgi:hypothetical protein
VLLEATASKSKRGAAAAKYLQKIMRTHSTMDERKLAVSSEWFLGVALGITQRKNNG